MVLPIGNDVALRQPYRLSRYSTEPVNCIAFRYIKRALLKLGTSYIDGWMGDG